MYLDLYALQSVPPSNINRDDTGSPKTAMYGGALRPASPVRRGSAPCAR